MHCKVFTRYCYGSELGSKENQKYNNNLNICISIIKLNLYTILLRYYIYILSNLGLWVEVEVASLLVLSHTCMMNYFRLG